MSKIIDRGRVKTYTEKGLVEEREASPEDLIEVLLNKLENEYVIEGELTIGNQVFKFKLRIKKISG